MYFSFIKTFYGANSKKLYYDNLWNINKGKAFETEFIFRRYKQKCSLISTKKWEDLIKTKKIVNKNV